MAKTKRVRLLLCYDTYGHSQSIQVFLAHSKYAVHDEARILGALKHGQY